jgi:hypothetical protein
VKKTGDNWQFVYNNQRYKSIKADFPDFLLNLRNFYRRFAVHNMEGKTLILNHCKSSYSPKKVQNKREQKKEAMNYENFKLSPHQ